MNRSLLIRNVAVGARHGVDVRVRATLVETVGRGLPRDRGEPVLDGAGGALICGLHDHHVHLRAAAAARGSADVSPALSGRDFDRLVSAAAAAPGPGSRAWVRVTGWDDTASGPVDRWRLDALTGQMPVRVQHRSGAMWVLNSAALRLTSAASLPGAERDERGELTGRLLRLDRELRDRLPAPDNEEQQARLAEFSAEAARLGITGLTDATPDRDEADVADFSRLSATGQIAQRLMLMAPPGLRLPGRERGQVALGPTKIVLDDATLPDASDLARRIAGAHLAGSAVAVHCVTAGQLVLTAAALAEAGPMPGDRIEHASVVPPGCAAELARLGVAVVTQPGFVTSRGDSYLRDVEPAELDWLYPCASLARAGVTVAAGTDAPFGPADPWLCIAAAVTRRTAAGQVLRKSERLTASRALRLFLAAPDDLRRHRTVAPGQPADLVLLHVPLHDALSGPDRALVRATLIAGQLVR